MEYTGGAPLSTTNPTFFHHVFSTTEEGKAEVFNTLQYTLLAIVPIIALNKLIQKFVPEADLEKSTLELLIEIMLQLAVIFCGIIVIHRTITYIPTYSGYRYESLMLTNAILPFLVIILSIQSKIGIKVNIIYDRFLEQWNGDSDEEEEEPTHKQRKQKETKKKSNHSSDNFDEHGTKTTFPPPPMISTATTNTIVDDPYSIPSGPLPANGVLGSSFGSFF
jgi:hypothetical protein